MNIWYFDFSITEAELNIAHLEDFDDDNDDDKEIEIYEGNDAVIPCQVPESIPPAFVHFLYNEETDLDSELVMH